MFQAKISATGWRAALPLALVVSLTACSAPARLGDGRAQALLGMPVPLFYSELRVAKELTAGCPAYSYDTTLETALIEERMRRSGSALEAARRPGAIELEADVKRRSLAARYGQDYSSLNPCTVLDGETARAAPLSVMSVKRG